MPPEAQPVSGVHYIRGMGEFLLMAAKRRLLLLLIAPFLVAVIAYFGTYLLPRVYMGYATIASGKIAGEPIQTVQSLADRVSSPTFRSATIHALKLDAGKDRATSLIYDTILPRAMPPSAPDILEISVRGFSAEEITAVLQTVVRLLGEQQAKIAETMLTTFRAKLALVKSEKERLNATSKKLQDTLDALEADKTTNDEAGRRENAMVRLLEMIENTHTAIGKLSSDEIVLVENLSTAKTFVAHNLDDIFVAPTPVSPRRLSIAGLAWFGVFALCLLFAIATAPTNVNKRSW